MIFGTCIVGKKAKTEINSYLARYFRLFILVYWSVYFLQLFATKYS